MQLKYGNEVDVVKFINGKRHTINPAKGIVEADLLFDFFDNQKCSIRLSRPHEFSSSLAKLMCLSDELFENESGVNAYITPYPIESKVEQGFAPHYDDIDAFLLQLEGKKQWNLYRPPSDDMLLDIEPSKDFAQSLITENKLKKYWSGTLGEGDLLYMPRGVIHFGKTFSDPKSQC
jgi:lysine-specific demethylase/histidyl-hydroxylase NO66